MKSKFLSDRQKIINVLHSNLSMMTNEYPDTDNELLILDCFYNFLYGAKVDSTIIVEVLDSLVGFDDHSKEYAKELAMGIKVNEGW